MIEPVIESLASITGLLSPQIEIIGSYPRNTYIDKKCCIDILVPVKNQDIQKKVLMHFDTFTGKVKNRGFMVEAQLGWGFVGIIPALMSDKANYFCFSDFKTGKTIYTNPISHINYIKNSGKHEIIKEIKLWLRKNNFSIQSFATELIVLEAIRTKRNAESDFDAILKFLNTEFETTDIFDPTNGYNNVTASISKELRKNISKMAQDYLKGI